MSKRVELDRIDRDRFRAMNAASRAFEHGVRWALRGSE